MPLACQRHLFCPRQTHSSMARSAVIRLVVLSLALAVLPALADEPNAVAIEAVKRLKGADLSANPALKRAVEKVVDDVRGRGVMVELIRDFDLKERVPDLVAYLRKHPGDEAALDAIQYLGATDPNALREDLRGAGVAPEMVATIGKSGRSEWTSELVRIASSLERSQALRESAVTALISTETGAESLLRLLGANGLSGGLADLATQGLQGVRWPKVREQAQKLGGTGLGGRSAPQLPRERVLQLAGDPARGAMVFRRPATGCMACHQIGREGVEFGPNLGEIGAKLGKEALYDAIVEPSSGISFGFEAWLLTLRDGDEVLGLISSETDQEVALKVPGGQVLRYRKAEILKRDKQAQSIMPAGMQEALSAQDFADLLTYLSSLKPRSP